MTFLPSLGGRRIATEAATLLATAVALLSTSEAARADHHSIDVFPNLTAAHNIAVTAWSGYLDHCQDIFYYAYDGSEHRDFADAYAFAPIKDCQIYFNVEQGSNYRWKWFCSVVVHEMGHSAGLEHNNADKRDIMNGPGEIYWRGCLTKKQARKMKRRGKIIDSSINSWAYAKPSASAAGRESQGDHDHATSGRGAEAFESGDLHRHLVAVLPVR